MASRAAMTAMGSVRDSSTISRVVEEDCTTKNCEAGGKKNYNAESTRGKVGIRNAGSTKAKLHRLAYDGRCDVSSACLRIYVVEPARINMLANRSPSNRLGCTSC